MANRMPCPRCKSTVLLEQDGRSCSNCGRNLLATERQHSNTKTQPEK